MSENNKTDSSLDDTDDIVDVSSEDEEVVSMTEIVNNMVNKLKNSSPEQLHRLNEINTQLLNNCNYEHERVKTEEVD